MPALRTLFAPRLLPYRAPPCALLFRSLTTLALWLSARSGVATDLPPTSPPKKPAHSPKHSELPAVPTQGEHPKGLAFRTLGLTALHQQGPGDAMWGGAVAIRGQGLLSGPWASARYHDRVLLGYSNQGLVYRIQNELSVGGRYKLWREHGPIARLGWALDFRGHKGYRQLSFRVPEINLGWSGLSGTFQYEIAGTASPYTLRRENIARGKTQKTGGASAGWIATVGLARWRANARGDFAFGRKGRSFLVQGDLCAMFGAHKPKPNLQNRATASRHRWFGRHAQRYRSAICANAWISRGFAIPHPMRPPWQVGVTASVGKISFLDPTIR